MRTLRVCTSLLLLVAAVASAQTPRRPFLFKDVRSELALARAKGDRDVLLVIASMPRANASVAKAITSAGGTVQFRDDDVDYLRARVPLDKVEALASDRNVHSISISTRPSPEGGGGNIDTRISATDTTKKREWPRPLLSWYPITNRYDPLGDLRALEWRRQNPTFDGRGVTLAMIDMSSDALLPELQSALTLDGKPVPKVAGYETAIDSEEEPDGRWLKMKDTVSAANGQIRYQDRTYTAPRAGTFRVELLDEAVFDSLASGSGRILDRDLNRDGNPEGSSRRFAVLWDERTDEVWVDTDQDGSFANEKTLTDFRVRQEFGVFGKDKPETSVRESVGFAVQIDKTKKQVAINAGIASHASLVVGAALASRGENGRFNGVAPGAQLVNVAEGCATYGQTEAVIQAFKNPKVDLAWLEHCSNITRPYTVRDGRLATTVIYDRLIAKYQKYLMVPTHNYPVLGGTDDIVMARGAIGVGGHESKENFFINHGVRVQHADNLLITGGYGPMGNGAFGPDIITPSNYISTALGWQETRPIAGGLYRLPPGYTIAGGTSTATPTASGAVALLISAAKQSGVKHDPYRVKHAVISSARYVSHIPAYKQGSGVLNVEGAWEILKALDKVPELIEIEARAPVRHSFSQLLATPHEGVGIYERGGWTAGQRGERTVTFTRRSGPRQPMTFAIKWIGNDQKTFSSPESVTLPLNQPVAVKVGIAPAAVGAHSAILTLNTPSVPGHSHRMLALIVAGDQLNAANSFKNELKTEVPRPEMRSYFYDVPAGAGALRVDVQSQGRDVAVAVVRPDTRTASAVRAGGDTGGGRGAGGGGNARRATYVVSDPMPGIWEVRLADLADVGTFDAMQAEKDEPVPPTAVTLTVSAISAELGVVAAKAASDGTPTPDVSMSNHMATFTGSIAGLPVGSARRERATIRQGQQLSYEIDVPAGSTSLLVRAGNVSDPAADLDVYAIDCTGRQCRTRQTDSDPVGDEIVTIQNPAAGKWKVIVDAAHVPSGSVSFDYADVVFNPSYGAVTTSDVAKEHKTGEPWTAKTHAWFANALPAGRQPFTAVLLQGSLGGGATFPLNILELGSATAAASSQQR